MNTQNNEHDRLVDLLAATSQDNSHVIRTHLKNRLEDQEVIDAVIDYASTVKQARSQLEIDTQSQPYGGNEPFPRDVKEDSSTIYGGHEPFPRDVKEDPSQPGRKKRVKGMGDTQSQPYGGDEPVLP
jgi:hypothetical protein